MKFFMFFFVLNCGVGFGWAETNGHIEQNPLVQESVSGEPQNPETRNTMGNVLKFGLLVGMVIIIFLLLSQLKIPIPFRFAPASEITQMFTAPTSTPSVVPTSTPAPQQPSTQTIIANTKDEILKVVNAALKWATFIDGNLSIGGGSEEPVSQITLSTSDTTDGDININPDGSGKLNLILCRHQLYLKSKG